MSRREEITYLTFSVPVSDTMPATVCINGEDYALTKVPRPKYKPKVGDRISGVTLNGTMWKRGTVISWCNQNYFMLNCDGVWVHGGTREGLGDSGEPWPFSKFIGGGNLKVEFLP